MPARFRATPLRARSSAPVLKVLNRVPPKSTKIWTLFFLRSRPDPVDRVAANGRSELPGSDVAAVFCPRTLGAASCRGPSWTKGGCVTSSAGMQVAMLDYPDDDLNLTVDGKMKKSWVVGPRPDPADRLRLSNPASWQTSGSETRNVVKDGARSVVARRAPQGTEHQPKHQFFLCACRTDDMPTGALVARTTHYTSTLRRACAN